MLDACGALVATREGVIAFACLAGLAAAAIGFALGRVTRGAKGLTEPP